MRAWRTRRILLALTLILLLLLACGGMAWRGRTEGPTEYYEIQIQASRQLERCFAAVKGYKAEVGIPMSGEDLHQTGMIGQSYTGITTTLGAVEAKRTTAWPEMGALCVRLLYEAGVRPGDTVGAGFSGSFPGMDLALVAACESMDVKLICIASVGASTYGANDPELTLPEMLWRLKRDGLIQTESAMVTIGGSGDVGRDMDQELAGQIRARLLACGLNLVEEADFQKNLALREELYRTEGPIRCFVAVGGNITSMGEGESGISLGQGVLYPLRSPQLDESSGLVQRYLAQGVPVINLLNIKKLTADYGLPFDPADWPEEGTSAVYFHMQYPKGWLALGAAGSAALLLWCGAVRKCKGAKGKGEIRRERKETEDPDDR